MTTKIQKTTAKKATNLSIRKDLLSRARELEINLSATLEKALHETIGEKERSLWQEKNRGAVKAYNEDIKKHGLFSAHSRSF
ncbi:type II toxin-antitoxin system CcdA family antitoxin [Desulfoluna sp.]|uniref:type II toxin-antitoxin system CcdA family antitoxin n=1 Tax=Desulfoluna sp. TaxID=2045199 RepID=UPI0026072900|nr:type II toxin-antitoxin system CcdA family antitoxin [Desulfoluna sp.]